MLASTDPIGARIRMGGGGAPAKAPRLGALLRRSQPARARTCAPRGRGVGRWGPASGRGGFGAQPRLGTSRLLKNPGIGLFS